MSVFVSTFRLVSVFCLFVCLFLCVGCWESWLWAEPEVVNPRVKGCFRWNNHNEHLRGCALVQKEIRPCTCTLQARVDCFFGLAIALFAACPQRVLGRKWKKKIFKQCHVELLMENSRLGVYASTHPHWPGVQRSPHPHWSRPHRRCDAAAAASERHWLDDPWKQLGQACTPTQTHKRLCTHRIRPHHLRLPYLSYYHLRIQPVRDSYLCMYTMHIL